MFLTGSVRGIFIWQRVGLLPGRGNKGREALTCPTHSAWVLCDSGAACGRATEGSSSLLQNKKSHFSHRQAPLHPKPECPPTAGASLVHTGSVRPQRATMAAASLPPACKSPPLNRPALVGYPCGDTSEPPKSPWG